LKTGVLLINLGTPDSPSTADVRKYLSEFLNDPRVIDIAPLARMLLVNLVIVPFRAPKSAALYKEIWSEKGSPLLIHGLEVQKKLQEALGPHYFVAFGMRYQSPSLANAMASLEKQNLDRLVVLPLYPQYASSSTGSTLENVYKELSRWTVLPDVTTISQFYDKPDFLKAWLGIARQYNHNDYDHVVFSFHGLPERQIKKADCSGTCLASNDCCTAINQNNHHCYRAASFATARAIAKGLDIPENRYTVSFQSRLGKDPWIKPYSDKVIEEKAESGLKRLLVFSPAFVADCLETIYEIGIEYQELFKKHGGEHIQLVESLNSHPLWIEALKKMVQSGNE
jgi:ferrochelatase